MTHSWDRLNQLSSILKGGALEANVKPTYGGIVTLFQHHSIFLEEVRYAASRFSERTGRNASQTAEYIIDTFKVYDYAMDGDFWANVIGFEVEQLFKNYASSMDGMVLVNGRN